MKLKVFSSFIYFILSYSGYAQFTLDGMVRDASRDKAIGEAEVYIKEINKIVRTDSKGKFIIKNLDQGNYTLVAFVSGYDVYEESLTVNGNTNVIIELTPYSTELSEVVINQKREEIFSLNRLNPVEGTAIYAGKKTEVVLLDQVIANVASNNARQIYSQVVGLNIYENNDGGLQLNLGGRGLDPNRTSNFNTRQNGYDISADVLGYPESYYTPPAEALSQIQVVRGAASLQYGTQFGGLINFIFKKPNPTKKIELTTRQTVGSFGLFTSFNSLSGTIGKFSYYTYFNHKQGDGFRPNAGFESNNAFASLNYAISPDTKVTFEATYLDYLAQQAGGLTDTQFNRDIDFSNRDRNWFEVNWKLFALKLTHKFSPSTDFSLNLFSLDAERNALGFRGDPQRPERNPITEIDDETAFTRDLIKGEFNNWGLETRLLKRYSVFNKDAVFLLGGKYYDSQNTSVQGSGTNAENADFSFNTTDFRDYPNQSAFDFPNLNWSIFGENVFFITDKLSVTPGFRYENITTESQGNYTVLRFDNAGNEIFRQDTTDNRSFDRSFVLLGLGLSHATNESLEIYANLSQNYRSVTFSDIRVVNPTFIIDPNITDEEGFTADFGLRGKLKKSISYDIGGFLLSYKDRIGTILVENGPNKGDRVRKNIGDAVIYGLEWFADWNATKSLGLNDQKFRVGPFINLALTQSLYTESEENNVEDKQVEFIPAVNLKSGLRFGVNNFLANIQFTYLSKQYTDAENTPVAQPGDSREGIVGEIPAYSIMDLSLSYRIKKFKIESGINNLLDEKYFTRRATGYPGPGIIPSDPRSFYLTLQVKF